MFYKNFISIYKQKIINNLQNLKQLFHANKINIQDKNMIKNITKRFKKWIIYNVKWIIIFNFPPSIHYKLSTKKDFSPWSLAFSPSFGRSGEAVGLSAISFSAALQKDAAPIPNALAAIKNLKLKFENWKSVSV